MSNVLEFEGGIMTMMQWNDALKVGHNVIDRNHLELVGLINELGDAMSIGRGAEICGDVLNELATYTKAHFEIEDQLMTAHRYPAASEHMREHADLAQKVVELKGMHDAGVPTLSVFLLHFLMQWLTRHSLESDKVLARGISN